jgi:hypothetical protein
LPKDSTLEDLDALYESSRAVKRPLIGQAYLNCSFYDGRQWVMFDGNRIYEPQIASDRAKLTDNRIRPVVLTRVAKKTKTRPVWVGVPRTSSDDDIAASRFAEAALDWYWKPSQLNLGPKLRAALTWADVAFAAFWKVTWDPTKGNTLDCLVYRDGHPEAGKPVKDEYGAPLKIEEAGQIDSETLNHVEAKTVNMGDVDVTLRTFFHLFVDPLATEEGLGSAQFLIDEGIFSPDYVKDHYDVDLDPDTDPSPGVVESRLPTSVTGAGNPQGYQGVRLREYWHKPSSAHPNGRRVVWAKNKKLFEGDNPYPWLPYVMFGGTPVPGRFWPNSPVSDLISPQTELNKTKSQIADNAQRIGNPPLLEPVTMGEDFEWHGLPGERVKFVPTGGPDSAPAFMDVPELPAYVQNQLESIEQSIREISGQHEVSSSQVPAGVTAASAINLLQEQDDTRLGPDIADMETTLAEAGKRILWLLGRYCTDQRTMRIGGEDGDWDFLAWKGQMLEGCDDIEVQVGSGIPQSRAAKQATISQMLNTFIQNGKPLDDRTLRKVLREFEVGGLESFFSTISRDETQVNDENRRMCLGEEVTVNSFDNDQGHVTAHQEFRKTARYRRTVAQNPDVDAMFEAHVSAHKERMAQQALDMSGAGQLQLPDVGAGPPQPPSPNGQPA